MTPVSRVNLLPDAIHWDNLARARRKVWAVILSLIVVSSALTWQWSSRRGLELSRENTRLETALKESRRQKLIASSQAVRIAELESRFEILDAMRGPEDWSKRVAIIVKSVPADMVLTRLNAATQVTGPAPMSQQRDARPAPAKQSPSTAAAAAARARARPIEEVRMDGYALSNTDIAMFLRRLKGSGLFRNVDLVSSSRETQRDYIVQSFAITCAR